MTKDTLLDRFRKGARYYSRGVADGHYAIRLPSGKLLIADDPQELYKLYASAMEVPERDADHPR